MFQWVVLLCFASTAAVTITGDTVWVVSPTEPEALLLSLEAVETDSYKVLGIPPVVLPAPPTALSAGDVVVFFGTNAPWLANFSIPRCAECFSIQVVPYAGGSAIVAAGADTRGAIYAGFTFSEQILNVDPWYLFTDHPPAYLGSVSVADNFTATYGPPTVQRRGWFINDEDLLGGLFKDPLGENVFSLQAWQMVYETLLRLKGNTVIVGTNPYPDERSIRLAARRGLIVTHHHYNLLGMNIWRWPDGVPCSFPDDPDIMSFVWRTSVLAQQNYDVVWSVGYRGRNDYPFWIDDPSYDTPQKRGALISAAIRNQTALVQGLLGPNATFITYLWAEGVDLYAGGYLVVPDFVTVVFADDGTGIVADRQLAKPGDGLYYHTAMLSGNQNQLTELVPPSRIFSELGYFVQKQATSIMIDNLSDVRPVSMTSDAWIKFVWNATPYMNTDPVTAQQQFLLDWSTRQFGAATAQSVANVYEAYFNVPYMQNSTRLGEQYVVNLVRGLAYQFEADFDDDQRFVQSVAKAKAGLAWTSGSVPYLSGLFANAQAVAPSIPPDRARFYQYHVLTGISIHLYINLALANLSQSVLDFAAGAQAQAIAEAAHAVAQFAALNAAQRAGEFCIWHGMYRFDVLDDIFGCRDQVRRALAMMQKQPPPPLPPTQGFGSDFWYNFYDYQLPAAPDFPLFYWSDTDNIAAVVRAECDSTSPPGCRLTAVGANYTADYAVVNLSTPASGVTIRYTLDGSDPTPTSDVYTTPFKIALSHVIRASSFIESELQAPVSVSLWFNND